MLIRNPFKEKYYSHDRRALNMLALRVPGLAFILMIYVASIVLQFLNGSWSILLLNVFTVLTAIFALLHWHSYRWVKKRVILYFVLQGLITFTLANVMSGFLVLIIIGLYAFLIGQIIGMADRRKTFLILYLLLLLSITVLYHIHKGEYLHFLVIAVPIMIVIITYAATFFAQVDEKTKAQLTLERLELAHQQVEQLTLQNERQRMARDLHDTLAQGLVSLNMQLDAIHVHLAKDNTERAKEIVQQSMNRVKSTLADARSAIDDLRSKSEEIGFLKERITSLMDHFQESTGMACFLDYRLDQVPDVRTAENCYYIIGECIANAVKHAEAETISVSIWDDDKRRLHLTVKDNGKGFDVEKGKKKRGHYGLLGIEERVRAMKGKFNIKSTTSKGTQIDITVPIQGEMPDE
ncbi:sensor histidine kinase [Bacillus licheniformis]|uniref:sensor histidine kinase n=1 Tax=Bacillus licheniformis TaxID=1402 RepID=UPI0011A24E1B|nr:sensor histidine kinase [Bacillus licheniformis]MBU8560942.1 sensor histidine kinase [Bacillus licheniformis]MDE1365315.1 sensor histidine kinase [Bacillus licheniformis]MDE1434016.1 sensor histidine kinase [Bacillus licheniformis]MEC1243986.1 sensor histidine kinase [Bacillus licheniformis]MEC1325618.1 sensor histidine kinase [Bacillus licheniformis]